jgi:hypothetical protein
MATRRNESTVDRMRGVELPIPLLIGVALLIVAGLCFAFIVRPTLDNRKITREWSTPEAAAARAPGGRRVDPKAQAALEAALQKEGRVKRPPRSDQ